jgi:hypothetical protein
VYPRITQLSININLVLGGSLTVINSQNDDNLYVEFLGPSGYTCLNSQLPLAIVAAKKTTSLTEYLRAQTAGELIATMMERVELLADGDVDLNTRRP